MSYSVVGGWRSRSCAKRVRGHTGTGAAPLPGVCHPRTIAEETGAPTPAPSPAPRSALNRVLAEGATASVTRPCAVPVYDHDHEHEHGFPHL